MNSSATRLSAKVVLITTPSLERSSNVSGVAAVVRGIQDRCSGGSWRHVPEIIGRRDGDRGGLHWILAQFLLPLRFAKSVLREKPAIIHINGPLSSLSIFRDASLVVVGRLFAIPVIYHLHGGPYIAARPTNGVMRLVVKFALSTSQRILVLGRAEADFVKEIYDAPEARVRVVPNAVDVPDDIPPKATEGPLKVLYFGRITVEKGVGVMCDAFEAGPLPSGGVELRMFGAGPLTDEVVSRLRAVLRNGFDFGGVADAEQLQERVWLGRCDADAFHLGGRSSHGPLGGHGARRCTDHDR
jgi:glycosyltransferase involved in cell wall biosynthesis